MMENFIKICKIHGNLKKEDCYFTQKYNRLSCKKCCNKRKLNCTLCKKEHYGNSDKKYCSSTCRLESFENKRKQKYIKCPICTIEFLPWNKRKFCSIKCGVYNRRVKTRECNFCKKEYTPCIKSRKKTQKFCSLECHLNNKKQIKQSLILSGYYNCQTHGKMTLENFNFQKKRKRYYCRICNKEKSNEYLKRNKLILQQRKKERYQNNPTVKKQYKIRQQEWRKKNKEKDLAQRAKYREKYREQIREKHKLQVQELKDYYVKSCLVTSLKISEIPKELIEAKKSFMKLKRKLKEIKQNVD